MDDEQLSDTNDTARHFKVTTRTVREWAAKGRIPVYRINARCFRFDLRAVRQALKARSGSEQTMQAR